MTFSGVAGTIGLALLEGALVAAPRPSALRYLRHWRARSWAAVLPGAILLGTFGPLVSPSIARGLVVLTAVMTPLLASIAAVTVVRRRAAFVGLAFAAFAVILTRDGGWIGQTGASVLTALGCLVLGAALVRLIPGRMMITGVALMCAVDVALLAIGVAQPSSAAVSRATSHFHGPAFHDAALGSVSTDYPDLVLAAIVGVMLASRRESQRLAAGLVIVLATAYGLLALLLACRLPATVPLVGALMVLYLHGAGRRRIVARIATPDAPVPEHTQTPQNRSHQ